MLEPITLGMLTQTLATSQLLGSIIGGWLGNRSDHYLCRAASAIYENLKHQSTPVNHDIQRAMRGAFLRATLMACEHRLYKHYNWVDRRLHLPTYDLKEVATYLKNQLKALNKVQFVEQANAANYRLLLEPTGKPADSRVTELKQQLRKGMLRELTDAELYLEDELKASILTGWTDSGLSVDWYDLLCAFFSEQLKTDTRLSTIIHTDLLRELRTNVPDIQWPDHLWERQATIIGEAMQPLVDRFDAVMERLDVLLTVMEDVRVGVVENGTKLDAAHSKLDALLGKAPRQPGKYLNTFAHYDMANLVGRTQQLAEIDAHFQRHRLLVLRGIGGIGKTTLARAYLSSRAGRYTHVAFLEIPEISNIAETLLSRLGTSPDVAFTYDLQLTADDNLTALLDVLRGISNTLLVIDNANNTDDLRKRKNLLDSLSGWTVLITSRARIRAYQQEDNMMEIKKLDPDEALELFNKLYGIPITVAEEEQVRQMLANAYYHPKLIEVLAKAARKNPLLTVSALGDLVARQNYDDDEIDYPIAIGDDEKPVYRILLDLFDTSRLTAGQEQLLRFFAVLPLLDIPIQHLIDLLGISEAATRKTLFMTLNELVEAGWLDDLNNRYCAMHGLVQWAVRKRLIPTLENCHTLISETANLIYRLNEANPLTAQPYTPYADELLTYFDKDENGPLTTLYNNIAASYAALGRYEVALKYEQKVLSIRQAVLPIFSLDIAKSYNNIALTYGLLRQHNNALAYAQQALPIFEGIVEKADSDLAQFYNNIGTIYRMFEKYDKALEYSQKALAIRQNSVPLKQSVLAKSYSDIAAIYGALRQHDKALEYNQDALTIREAILSENHPDLALSYNNIAWTYYYLDEIYTALFYVRKAVAIREQVLPPDHPDLLISQRDLAFIEETVRQRGSIG